MDALAMGAVVALMVRGDHGRETLKLVKPLALAGATMVALAVAWSLLRAESSFLPALSLHSQLLSYPGIELISAALVLVAISAQEGVVNSVLSWEPFMTLGKYSYGLYLIHVPIRDVLRTALEGGTKLPVIFHTQLISQAGAYLIGIGASVLFAMASWHCFEKHFLRLKDRFPYQAPGSNLHAPCHTETSPGAIRFERESRAHSVIL
jgi:peptidoglycan/LPS O-acetylase OafA/YrhL